MPDTGETHFGFQTVDLARKQAMVDEVFHRVARRYDLMNDLMSAGLHRTWKDAMVSMLNPPRTGRYAVADVAGGTGDVAFRIAEAGGPGTTVTVCDINPDMLAVGQSAPGIAGSFPAIFPVSSPSPRATPKRCVPRSQPRRLHHRVRHPQCAAHRCCAARILPGIAAWGALRVSRIFHGRRARLATLYDLYSFNIIPALGRAVAGDAGILPLSRRIDPALPASPGFCGDDLRCRFSPCQPPPPHRRRGGAAFGLASVKQFLRAAVIAAFSHIFRLGQAGFVFAREGVFGLVDPAPLPAPARLAVRLARLIERRYGGSGAYRLSAALTTLGPSYVKLGQFLATRPDVVGPAIARDLESLQDKMAPFPQEVAEAAVSAAFDCKLADVFVKFSTPVAAASIAQVHRAETKTLRSGCASVPAKCALRTTPFAPR